MNLPRKDENGKSYLSYSQISLFIKDKQEYYRQYVLNEKWEGNVWTDWGSKVGVSIETNCFDNFNLNEVEILKQVPRLDEFEKPVILDYGNFFIKGFIDTNSKDYKRIIDIKTGGKDKEHQYKLNSYTQLCYYALSIRQMYGITPEVGQVCFIRRGGNPYKNQPLIVADEKPLLIDVDISMKRLKQVYWDTIKIAKEIELFYEQTKN